MKTAAETRAFLKKMASKYVWFKTPDTALELPHRVIAQVMDLGIWEDLLKLENFFGKATLRKVLRTAEIGQFRPKSWHFWHYRLGLAEVGKVPPMPRRKLSRSAKVSGR